MLHNLEIEGFRTFKEYAVEDLGRVNLFVGRNNSGKTTILEAGEMLLATDTADAIVGCAMRRGELYIEQDKEKRSSYVDVSHLFHGHRCEIGRSFRIKGSEGDYLVSMTCEVLPAETDLREQRHLFDDTRRLEPDFARLLIRHSQQSEPFTVPLAAPGVISPRDIRRASLSPSPSPEPTSEEKPVSFIRTEALGAVELQEFWDAIVLTEEESNVVESLRILEPQIERIAFLSSRPYYRYNPSSGGIYIRLRNLDKRIPLGSLGDGIRHLFTLFVAVGRAPNGYVMVDEIDTGLHHSVMADMWRALIATAQRLNVQIFATTHSLDCVRSLAWLANTQPNLCESVRMHRVDSERSSTVVYGPDEISIAAEQHVELRG
jgi:hypothetical protein